MSNNSLDDALNDLPDYSDLSEYEIRKEYVWRWFHCLRQNGDYEKYCLAKRNKNESACIELESEFELIADLFEDWEDIHILPSMQDKDSENWKKWLARKHHLFFPASIELFNKKIPTNDMTNIAVSVPMGFTKKSLKIMFDKFLDDHQEIQGQWPKYNILELKGKTLVGTLLRMDVAEIAVDLVVEDDQAKEYMEDSCTYTATEFAASIMKSPFLRKAIMGWHPNSDEQREMVKVGIVPATEVKNQARTINNLKKFRNECIKGTVKGIFPSIITGS